MRLLSLMMVWALVVCGSLMTPVLPVLGGARMAFGGSQLLLNHRLARRTPIAGRDRYDWALLGLALLGSIGAAAAAKALAGEMTLPLLLPVLLPYSAIQLRSFRRSLDAHNRVNAPIAVFPGVRQRRAA
jgi:hypothetical protein